MRYDTYVLNTHLVAQPHVTLKVVERPGKFLQGKWIKLRMNILRHWETIFRHFPRLLITVVEIDNYYSTALAEFVWAVSECLVLIGLDAGHPRHDIVGREAIV